MDKSKLPESFLRKEEKVKLTLKALSTLEGLIFKGGTSLSLTRGVLERFSEDVDISYDRTLNKDNLSQKQMNAEVEKILCALEWPTAVTEREPGTFFVQFKNDAATSEFDYVIHKDSIKVEMATKNRNRPVFKFEYMEPFEGAGFQMNVSTLKSTLYDKASLIFLEFFKHGVAKFASNTDTAARHLFDLNVLVQETKQYTIPKEYLEKRIYDDVFKKDIQPPQYRGTGIQNRQIALMNYDWKEFERAFKGDLIKYKSEIKNSIDKIVFPGASAFDFDKMIVNVLRYSKIYFELIKSMI